MMMSSAWSGHEAILRCPTTRQALSLLSESEIAGTNAAIGSGLLRHANAEARPLESSALGTPDRKVIYRIEDDVACLLPELAISATHEGEASRDEDSAGVRRFYDEYGWRKNPSGSYNDTADFTDTRAVSAYYGSACNHRIVRQLRSGRYLLDAASGPIPHAGYLQFSKNYDFRICLDFSITALREAKAKLGAKGLYVLGDITRLPFAEASIDDVISLHTIYHVPRALLATAVDELVRVVGPDGRVVIVSTWASSPLMGTAMKGRSALGKLKRLLLGRLRPAPAPAPDTPQTHELYFAPFDYDRYRSEIASRHPTTLRLWSSTSVPFQKAFFADNRVGLLSAKLVLTAERLLEPLAARYGQYPMFVVDKGSTIEPSMSP
jgi:SAM-dependent methyltransferase